MAKPAKVGDRIWRVADRKVRGRVVRGRKNPLCYSCGKRLRLLREMAGVTQIALARASGVNNVSMSMFENEQRMLEIDTIEQLAAALRVSPTWLAFGPEGFQPFRQKLPRTAPGPTPEPTLVQLKTRSVRHQGCPDRLRLTRASLGLSYRDMEQACGISGNAIMNTENRVTIPKIQTLEAIAVALDVAPGWLAYGEKPRRSARLSKSETAAARVNSSAVNE